ncbi:MAG: hypothetical protein H3Z54_06385 [archaeon]|nr:hypothetical protein [archaeon]
MGNTWHLFVPNGASNLEILKSFKIILAKTELRLISLEIICNCGKSFIAEDLEPECPYCDKKYSIQIYGSSKGIELKITQIE